MRPKSGALRYAYVAAAAKLQLEQKDVTIRSLAEEMGEDFKAAQRYLYRNEDVAKEIGLTLEHTKHDELDYTAAILNIPVNVRPTNRRLGSALGVCHSSVAKFLKEHPELKRLHPRFECGDILEEVEAESEPENLEEDSVMRTWRDLYVIVWHERSGRYVGEVANRTQYLTYWEKGLLKHLHEGLPMPSHLPTPEEVVNMD
ncbi:MAG TPA: hypothetical protein VMU25_03795 [Candidatus Paceibacterota bacterium]|nr:hypothetical protein [Candidatus Paceibacterota bacterium]